ncbi:hypothetical protein ACOME3_009512 [Neoechinorhynchus agilis]
MKPPPPPPPPPPLPPPPLPPLPPTLPIVNRAEVKKPQTLVFLSATTNISFLLPVCRTRSDTCNDSAALSNIFLVFSILTTVLGIVSACLGHFVYHEDNMRVAYFSIYLAYLTQLSAFFMINSGIYLTVTGTRVPQSETTLVINKISSYFDNVLFSSIAFICLWSTIAKLKANVTRRSCKRMHPGQAKIVCTATFFMCLAWNLFTLYSSDICVYWQYKNTTVQIGYGIHHYYVDGFTHDAIFIPAIAFVVYSVGTLVALSLIYTKITCLGQVKTSLSRSQWFVRIRPALLSLGSNLLGCVTSILLVTVNAYLYRYQIDTQCDRKYETLKRALIYTIAFSFNAWYNLMTITTPSYQWWQSALRKRMLSLFLPPSFDSQI